MKNKIKLLATVFLSLLAWNVFIQEVDFYPNYYEAQGVLKVIPRFGPLESFGICWRSPGFRDKYGWGNFFVGDKFWPDKGILNHTRDREHFKSIESVNKLYKDEILYLEKELKKHDS